MADEIENGVKGKVEEVDKCAKFLLDSQPHLLSSINTVVFTILKNLYLALFFSQNIQKIDNINDNFLYREANLSRKAISRLTFK